MVDKEIIQKVFNNIYKTHQKQLNLKCRNSSEKAISRGNNGILKRHRKDYEITYPDGTHIRFDKKTHELIELTIDDESYKYLTSKNTEKLADYQGEILHKTHGFKGEWINDAYYGDENGAYTGDSDDKLYLDTSPIDVKNGFDFLTGYVSQYASIEGMALNSKLWHGKKLSNTPDIYTRGIISNKKAHDYFVELERTVGCDIDNILAVRYTNTNHYKTVFDVDKEFYTSKGHTSYTVGGNQEKINSSFYDEDGWTIITPIHKGSGVKGLFFGNLIPFSRGYGSDWEGKLNLPPGTKFQRDLIDEEHRIIIQHVVSQRGVK